MGKKITDSQKAELRGILQKAKDEGKDSAFIQSIADRYVERFGVDDAEPEATKPITQPVDKVFGVNNGKPKVEEPTKTEIVSTLNKMGGLQPINTQAKAKVQEQPTPLVAGISEEEKAQKESNFWTDYDTKSFNELFGGKQVLNGTETPEQRLSIIKNKQNEINSNLESDRNINYNVSAPSENSRINNADAVKLNFKKELRDFYDKAEGTIYADTEYVKPNARVQSADRNTLGKNISALNALSFPVQIGIKKLFNINQDEGATNQNLSEDFLRGLDARQTSDDIAVNRIRKQLNEGVPIASSDIELYTNIGQGIKAERLQQKLIKGEIDEATFSAGIGKIQADRKELYDRNPDLVQARLAKIIADESPKVEMYNSYGFDGWMYTDKELDAKKEIYWNRVQKENPSITRSTFETAFKNIKSDESILPFYNGIPKSGLDRAVVFGAADVLGSVVEGVKDIAPTAIGGKSYAQIYNESRNAEISDLGNKRTDADKNSKYYDVAYGFGQFLGQAGLAYAGGEVIGGASKLLGLGSKMTPTLEGSLGMETLMAEAETAAIAREGTKDAVGFFKSIGYDVTKQQLASTMTTAYIQSYDQNLKQAMSWTDDNGKAIKVANVLSAVEGGTELILPDIALANKFLSSLKGQGFGKYLLGLSKEEIASGAFKKGVKNFVRGVIEGGKIGLGENIEEQLSNLISYNIQNSIAPQTIDKSFAESAKETFIGTTLSMAVPMVIGFGGAFNKQPKYTKESVYNAAQNTSNALDILNNEFHEGRISEKELNESKAVVASARKANEEIRDIVTPDGERINTDNKIEYVNSRAKQFVLEAKLKNAKDDNNAAIANMLQKQIDNEVKTQESILTSPQAKPIVEAAPQTEEEKLQSLNTDGMQPSIQDNGQVVTTQANGVTTTTPTRTIDGIGTYEFEGKLYVEGKDGLVTYENGNLPPTAEQEKVKKEGIFTPITPISNEQAQNQNIQVPSTEGTAVNGQGEITAQPQEVSIPTGNTPQIETKPLIEVPNIKTNLAELASNNKEVFGDFAPIPRADGTYKPLELKKAIDIVEKYNEETQISNNAITQQNTKQNGKSNQEAINAKAEGQGQNDVVGNQVGVASTNKGTSTTATRTIEQIDLELETLDNSIGDNTTKDDLKAIFQQQKQLKAEKQQIVNTRNTEISKPFDEKITAFENEVSSLKKDIEDEGYGGKVLDNANAKIARLNDQIKATKEEKVKALAQPISPSRENGNAKQATTAKSKEKLPISSKVGESVTVNIGGKAISGIVESDEGGKLTLSSGNKIIELSNDQQYVDYASPVRLADNQDGIEVNGEVYTEVRFDISNGKEVAVLIKEDGSITTNSNPQIIEELKYQSALAMLDEMSEQEAQKLKQKYESKRTTEKPTEERTSKTDGTTQQKSEEEIKLQEAIDEIDLIEQIALDDLENNNKKARLIEHENGKTYLVEKNKDGSYTATLNGRKVRQGNHLNSLIEMYKTQSKKESDELIPKLQKQVDGLKQEVLDKLYNKKNTKEDATKESNKQQESGTESNISQREGTVQGQQEEGQGKGEQRSTENKGTDNSNSNKPSEAQKEVEKLRAKEQGLQELFESNPDLANAVYEALGFRTNINFGDNQEIDNFKNDSNTKILPIQDILNKEKDPITRKLIKALSPYLNKASKIYYQDGYVFKGDSELASESGYAGTIDGKGNILVFDKDFLTSDVVLHELMHDFLLNAININKDEILINELTRIFNKAKTDTDLAERYSYAFSNLDEFVSEVFGNKGFRQELSYVKDFNLNRTSNIFNSVSNAIKDFLKRTFNFEISSTLLDSVFNAIDYTVVNKNKITPQQKQQAQQLYSQYLDSISSDSEVKDLGSKSDIEGFKKWKQEKSLKETTKEVVDEINSLNLTRVEGTNMGSKQADGTYVSTEKGGNRYEGRGKTTANSVEVNVTNPKVQTVEENTALRESILQTQLDNNEISIEDLSGEALVNAYDYFKSKGINNPTNKQVSEYIKTEGNGKIAIDDITDTKTAEVAKEITQQLKKEGYDSLYFREGNNQEGELIVFDNAKVKITNKENGKENEKNATEKQTTNGETGKGNKNTSASTKKQKNERAKALKVKKQKPKSNNPIIAQAATIDVMGDAYLWTLQKMMYQKYSANVLRQILGKRKKGGNDLSGQAFVIPKGEVQARVSFLRKNAVKSINSLGEQLRDAYVSETGNDTYDDAYFRDLAEEIILSKPSMQSMAEEILDKMGYNDVERYEQPYTELSNEFQDEADEAIDYANELTDAEIEEIIKNEKDYENSEEFQQYLSDREYAEYLASSTTSEFDEKPEKIQRIDDAKEKVSELAGKVNEAENTFYKLKENFDKEEAKKQNDLFNKGAVANLIDDTAERKAIVDEAKTKLDTLRNELSDARKELKKAQDDLTSNQTEIPFATNESAVGETKTTPQQKKEVSKIIEFFNKQFGLDVFAPFSEFASKLKSLGYDSLQVMYNAIGESSNFEKANKSLNEAKELEKKGVDNEDIFKQTGWYIDSLDGKWKYELPNSSKYKSIFLPITKNVSIGLLKSLKNDFGKLKLKDVIEYNELFEAYPEFKNIKVSIKKIDNAYGSYNPSTNEITLNIDNNDTDNHTTIIHEIQHLIQQKEGFAKGASPEREGVARVKQEIDNATARINEYERALSTVQEFSADANTLKANIAKEKSYIYSLNKDILSWAEYFYNAYAGEIEARAIEKRLKNKERENGSPNISKTKFSTDSITIQFLKKPNGEVLGFVDRDGKVYLNPDALTAETTFHELNHVQQSLIKIAAEQGDEKAKAVLRRWDKVVTDYKVMEQFSKGGKIKIDKATIDLSSDVYKQGENETQAQHEERIRNEVWSYLTAPENAKKWGLANKGSKISNFINSVVSYFKDKLGLKGLTNTQILNSTLKDLIEHTSNSLMKGEWLDIKNKPNTQNKNQKSASNNTPQFSIYKGEQDTPLTPQDEQDLEEVVDDIKSGNSTIEQYSKLLDQKSLDYVKSKLEPATKGKVSEANKGSISDTRKDPLRTTDNGTPYSFLELIKDDKDEHKAVLTTLDKDKQTISQTQDTTDDILGIQGDNFIIDSTTLGKMQEYADQDEQAIMKAIDGFPSEMKGDRDNVDLFLDALIETREQTGDTITPSNIRVIGIFNNLSATLNKQLADPNITTAQRSDIIAKIQKIDMLTRQIARSSGLVLNARRNFRNLFNAVNSVNIANLANNKILTTENETMVNDFVSSINEAFENDQLNSDNEVDINDEEEAPKPKTPKTKRSKPSKNLMSMFEGIMKIGESFKEQINKITCK